MKSSRFECHVQRVKRRIGFLIAIGASNRRIKRELGLENVKRYLAHPDVQAAIAEIEAELYERGEKRFQQLFPKSVKAIEDLLSGKIRKNRDRPSIRAIELVWTAHGRLPRGRDGEAQQTNIVNQPLIMDRADAKAAMALLRQERERQERERQERAREIELDPHAIERSGGERNGP